MKKIPKAFISHSSKDKAFASKVADLLGPLRCEFDEYSFDFTLNAQAIRNALSRSSLFVLLLSSNSINSSFVQDEIRAALESRAAGIIKDVLIFAIDQTSYKSLPAWLREINVAQHLRTPQQIARRIDSSLALQSLDTNKVDDFYLGREDQEQELRRLLAKPKSQVPVGLHVVGHPGVGRRTFLRKSLQSLAPRQYNYTIEININEYDGLIEIYRKLYDYTEVPNPLVAGEDFHIFDRKTSAEKYTTVARQIEEMTSSGALVLFVDEGGVYQDDGDYKDHFPPLLEKIQHIGRPSICFIQTRMMREIHKQKHKRSAHIRLPSLSDESSYELMCLILNELGIDYNEHEARQACKFAEGHPFNIKFIAAYVAGEGIDLALSDPHEILEMNYQSGYKFIRNIDFSETESDIMALLREYRFCELEFVLSSLENRHSDLTEAVRRLEDHCCIERRDRILTVAPPLRDAIRRDTRFSRSASWLSAIAEKVIDNLLTYNGEDNINISLIDSAIPIMIKSGKDIPFLTNLILPSHFLRVGRNYYDRSNWPRAIEFCRKALESEQRMSVDAAIEANRLLGLALTRINPDDVAISDVISKLRTYSTSTANRIAYFIEGFRARRKGDYDIAEDRYMSAAKLDKANYHISREISYVLCRMERFLEAEPYARIAYNRSPDNPYILDVLIEAIEGKAASGAAINKKELGDLYNSLKDACVSGGFLFYQVREARRLYSTDKERENAFALIGKAIDSSGDKIEAIYRRALMHVRSGDSKSARADIEQLRKIDIKESRRFADELEVNCFIVDNQFEVAKKFIDDNFSKARGLARVLETKLSRAIAFSPDGLPKWLTDWAKTRSG